MVTVRVPGVMLLEAVMVRLSRCWRVPEGMLRVLVVLTVRMRKLPFTVPLCTEYCDAAVVP